MKETHCPPPDETFGLYGYAQVIERGGQRVGSAFQRKNRPIPCNLPIDFCGAYPQN